MVMFITKGIKNLLFEASREICRFAPLNSPRNNNTYKDFPTIYNKILHEVRVFYPRPRVNSYCDSMARMHTKKHGKSKSRKPPVETITPVENAKSKKEIEALIAEYMKQGIGPTLIGQKLKDKDGVLYLKHTLGKRLVVVMKEKGFKPELPQDMLDLMKKAVNLRKHLANNKQDMHNKTSLNRVESKIWRLSRYYKQEGRLPEDWKYDPAKAALIIKS